MLDKSNIIIYIIDFDRLHHKNRAGALLLKDFLDIVLINEVSQIDYSNNKINVLICPDKIVESNKSKFLTICGPQISFTDSCLHHKHSNNIINILSSWTAEGACKFQKGFKEINDVYYTESNVIYVKMPFPVDHKRFCPQSINDIRCEAEVNVDKGKDRDYIVYYKHVDRNRLINITNALNTLNINYTVFEYGSYSETDYLDRLKRVKGVFWVGCHESQGFALQEALSCNVPILCFDVERLSDECIDGWHPWDNPLFKDVSATSASYWNDTCGRLVKYDLNLDFTAIILDFISDLDKYRPRDFILENLTAEKVSQQWVETIHELLSNSANNL